MFSNLKKADPHIHLEGSVSPATYNKLAAKYNKPSITSYPDKLDFPAFIKIYLEISSLIQDEEDILTITRDYLESCAKQSIVHSDIYFTPTTHKDKDSESLYAGLLESEKLATTKYSHSIRFIFDIVRNAPVPADETIKMAIDARKKGVNVFAIALAGYEAKKEAKYFVDAFKKARAEGFQTLAHAGETLGPENIWQTIKELEVTRIGHGVRAVEDEQLLDYIARNEIVLEVCPWSNIYLGVSDEDHPIAKLDKHGIKIVIGSDDPGIFSKDLNDNYALSEKLGLKNLERIAKNSLELSKK